MIYTIGYSYAMGQDNRQVNVNTIDKLKKELKSIDKSFTTQFFKRYHPESLTIAIAKYLFKLKLYSLLDTFMSCRFIK